MKTLAAIGLVILGLGVGCSNSGPTAPKSGGAVTALPTQPMPPTQTRPTQPPPPRVTPTPKCRPVSVCTD